MISIFSAKKMPVGLPEQIIELQQNWNTFLLKLEEQFIAGAHQHLHVTLQKAQDAYQAEPLAQYNELHARHTDNPVAADLLNHFRNKVYHVLLQWEKRLMMIQEKAIRDIAGHPDKKYLMVSTDDEGIIYHSYYGKERNGSEIAR